MEARLTPEESKEFLERFEADIGYKMQIDRRLTSVELKINSLFYLIGVGITTVLADILLKAFHFI